MAIDQKELNPELVAWLEARQARLQIVKTTKTPSGQTLDWVPVESQDPAGRIASPPPPIPVNFDSEDKLRPTKFIHFELSNLKVDRGPAGTVPLVRPDISHLTRTILRKDYLRKPPGRKRTAQGPRDGQPSDPRPFGYFHAQSSQSATVFGCEFTLNIWDPVINVPLGSDQDHSLLQTWLIDSPTSVLETVEGGWTVNLTLNGDLLPHVFTYFTTDGYTLDDDNLGGYNTQHIGWIQTAPFPYPGALLVPNSQFGGEQFDIPMKFRLMRGPDGRLDWWVALQGVWMGYYPGSLFKGILATGARTVIFGGEVLSTLPQPTMTKDQMGSGSQPATNPPVAIGSQTAVNFTHAAYLRNLLNQTDLEGTMVNHNGTLMTDTAEGINLSPYTVAGFLNSDTPWKSYLFLGGPTVFDSKSFRFDHINFTIKTGDDDLRGDSTATAVVNIAGHPQLFTLKKQGDPAWANGSTHPLSFLIGGEPQHKSAFGAITFTLISHDSFTETPDNWNVNSLSISLSGPNGVACLQNRQGDPLFRLTNSEPTIVLAPFSGC